MRIDRMRSEAATKLDAGSPYPQTKVTADDWLTLSLHTLIEQGIEHVRILPLAQSLNVSRASFYWYFKSRDELLERLLAFWREKNTRGLVAKTKSESRTIASSILNIFECWMDPRLFDPRLDFAIREWARRSEDVRNQLRHADVERIAAIAEMFVRHGFDPDDGIVRARILYFEQIGYYSLHFDEPLTKRLSMVSAYIRTLSGSEITPEEKRRHQRFVADLEKQRAAGSVASPD